MLIYGNIRDLAYFTKKLAIILAVILNFALKALYEFYFIFLSVGLFIIIIM